MQCHQEPDEKELDEGLLITTFMLGDALFGVNAWLVQEVVKVGGLTRVHHAPTAVAGIRNLRGRIVTVVDLALRLELGCVTLGPDARLLIMEWQGEPVGFLVDTVTDAITVSEERITPPPASIDPVLRRSLRGIWREGDRLIAILDPPALFQWDDVEITKLPQDQERNHAGCGRR
ncbi:MAG: chemotaxis protein CheW [Candidatus Contendobacter sp.]|nr:chemotaxis protein CheW [Candidatus Contendobacter sp.]